MASLLQDMYLWLGFTPIAAQLLVREQVLDRPDRLQVLANKNVDGSQVARMQTEHLIEGNKTQS